MFCEQCGTKIEDGKRFCSRCEAVIGQSYGNDFPKKAISVIPTLTTKLQRILLIIAMVFGIGVLIADSILMFRPSTNNEYEEFEEFEEVSLGIMDYLPYIILIISLLVTVFALIKATKKINLAAGIFYLISVVLAIINTFNWSFWDTIIWYWYYMLLIIPAVLCFVCFMGKKEK